VETIISQVAVAVVSTDLLELELAELAVLAVAVMVPAEVLEPKSVKTEPLIQAVAVAVHPQMQLVVRAVQEWLL
jgi:hypothetical protein